MVQIVVRGMLVELMCRVVHAVAEDPGAHAYLRQEERR